MPHAVAGIACGLFARTKPYSHDIDQYQILTDISVRPLVQATKNLHVAQNIFDLQGLEDILGNMDFKMAGTRNGITSIQVCCVISFCNVHTCTLYFD